MTTTAASAAVSATGAQDSAASRKKLAENLDTFLVLLTTQLKYQDPLSPMESTEFTNQLVQFANVEQQISVNENLETMISLQQSNKVASSVGYLGKYIQADDNRVPLQDGEAHFSYTLEGGNAAYNAVVISDEKGNVVWSTLGQTKPGTYDVEWDGKDKNGKQLPDGSYTVTVTAIGYEGQPDVEAGVTVTGKVDGVTTLGDEVILDVGGAPINLDKVIAVRDGLPPTKTTTTSSSSSSSSTN